MGCGVSKSSQFNKHPGKAAVLIQRWYRQYVARTEMRRRCTWHIFQSIEYSGEQAQIKLYNFLGYLMDNFTPSSNERKMFTSSTCEIDRYFCYKNIEVPEIYSGPHLTFPLTVEQAMGLVEAFRNKKQLHSRYILQLLLETWKLLRKLPNINRISTCQSKEITICGDLHGQLEDLLLIFYKNGMPSLEKPYVFNGDFVDRGHDSIEILIILFAFLLLYPSNVYLNRGNHEDHIVNLRYGFTKEVLTKYKMHGKRILKLLQKIFSWLPLATVIDQRVLVIHGGISDSTDLGIIARVDRHKVSRTWCKAEFKSVSKGAVMPPKRRVTSSAGMSIDSEADEEWSNSKFLQRRASMTYPKPFGTRSNFQNRSLQDFSDRIREKVEDEVELCRRRTLHLEEQNQNDENEQCVSIQSVNSDNAKEEWKQILDLLWSDPMVQDGCIPNEVRGGGCYWGPDVTEYFLNRHNLQLLIRSHECKQEGYEFCHNRKVLTLFSASNYYDVGSNRGAYVKLGPDLVPYMVQYQATSMTRELTVRQRFRSALKVLREQLFAHKSDLLSTFRVYDTENTGLINLSDWAEAVESVMHLGLPWRMLRSQLVTCKSSEGMISYYEWFNELTIKKPQTDHIDEGLIETLYRHRSTIETIFRIVDTDNSGFITIEDFRQTWKLLSIYLKMEITDEAISDLAVTIDSNNDGCIDIDEFMEAFRLTDKKSPRPAALCPPAPNLKLHK
uniref:Serine/threonine-protein phosphatase with EF-hands n=1 Tax=Periophthalmus magnuspinnatus TaxID=409849 RepID=A0A3B3ZU49_9GOBI